MTFNVFTRPKEAFKHAIEVPSLIIAFLIVFLTGLFWSAISFILLEDIFIAFTIILINLLQWVILAVLLFVFEILFSGQKRHQIRADFRASLSVVGKIWIYGLISAILFNIFAFTTGEILGTIIGILIFIVSAFAIYGSFIAVKVVLDSTNKRAIVTWILIVLTYFLLTAAASTITTIFLI